MNKSFPKKVKYMNISEKTLYFPNFGQVRPGEIIEIQEDINNANLILYMAEVVAGAENKKDKTKK
jgi:hypothetical protein